MYSFIYRGLFLIFLSALNSLVFVKSSYALEHLNKRNMVLIYRDLAYQQSQIDTLTQNYYMQLLNQDIVSTPQIEKRLSTAITLVDGYSGRLALEAMDAGVTEDRFVDLVFSEKYRSRYQDLPLKVESLPEAIVTRLSFFQERAELAIEEQLLWQPEYPVDFSSVVPSGKRNHTGSGFPNETVSDHRYRCTSGGFFTRATKPTGFVRDKNLLNNFEDWASHECSTPWQVRLSLNGRDLNFSRNPGGIGNENINKALNGQRLCNPLFYGFVPVELSDKNRLLGACHYPDSKRIGRSVGGYSENIPGRVESEKFLALPQSISMAGVCPKCLSKRPLESQCDRMARLKVAPKVKIPVGMKGFDGAIVLSAQLALENQALWLFSKNKFQAYCKKGPADFIESDHCDTMELRIALIEMAMEKLVNLGPRAVSEEDVTDI